MTLTLVQKKKRFNVFLKEHYGIVRKLCRGYSNNAQDFEDNVQEVCYHLWKSIDKFEGKSKASTWVYRLTLNVCLYNLNKRKKRLDYPTDAALIKRTTEELYSPQEDSPISILYEAITYLKPVDRAIIMLYLDKNDHATIAEIIGLSQSNIGVKINRIKKQLKKIVDERPTGHLE